MTGEEKLAQVEAQLTLYERGQVDALKCPYCEMTTLLGQILCCMQFGAALEAVLHRRESTEALDNIAKIAEKVAAN